jgi:hypothetical protein
MYLIATSRSSLVNVESVAEKLKIITGSSKNNFFIAVFLKFEDVRCGKKRQRKLQQKALKNSVQNKSYSSDPHNA